MSAAKTTDRPPVNQLAVDHAAALASEVIDLNSALRRLLGNLDDLPTAGEVLTGQIDTRLAEMVRTLLGEDDDKPPLKAVEE